MSILNLSAEILDCLMIIVELSYDIFFCLQIVQNMPIIS